MEPIFLRVIRTRRWLLTSTSGSHGICDSGGIPQSSTSGIGGGQSMLRIFPIPPDPLPVTSSSGSTRADDTVPSSEGGGCLASSASISSASSPLWCILKFVRDGTCAGLRIIIEGEGEEDPAETGPTLIKDVHEKRGAWFFRRRGTHRLNDRRYR